jgi:hypothetical protein
MKIHPIEAEFFDANQQRMRQKKMNLVIAFQNFAKGPKKSKILFFLFFLLYQLYNSL